MTQPLDALYDAGKIIFGAIVGRYLGVRSERVRGRNDDCRRLRDLVEELESQRTSRPRRTASTIARSLRAAGSPHRAICSDERRPRSTPNA